MATLTDVYAVQMVDKEAPEKDRPWIVRLVLGLFLDIGLWLGSYYLILATTGSLLAALLVAGAVALLRMGFAAVRTRHVDSFLAVVVLSFAISVLLALVTGDPVVLLFKSVVLTALWGAITLATLKVGKPLLFSMTQRLIAPGPEGAKAWFQLWETSTPFRWLYRRLTLVWGGTFLVCAAIQAVVVLTLPPAVVGPIFSVMSPVMTIGLITWTILYSQAAERSLERPLVDSDASTESSSTDD